MRFVCLTDHVLGSDSGDVPGCNDVESVPRKEDADSRKDTNIPG